MAGADPWDPYRRVAEAGRTARAALEQVTREELEATKRVTAAAQELAKNGASLPGTGPTTPGSADAAARWAAAAEIAAVQARVKTVDDAGVSLSVRRVQAETACGWPAYAAWAKEATAAFPGIERKLVSGDPSAEKEALQHVLDLGIERGARITKLREEVDALVQRAARLGGDATRERVQRAERRTALWKSLGAGLGLAATLLVFVPVLAGLVGAIGASAVGVGDFGSGCTLGCGGGAAGVVLVFVAWAVVRIGLWFSALGRSRLAEREADEAQEDVRSEITKRRAWLTQVE